MKSWNISLENENQFFPSLHWFHLQRIFLLLIGQLQPVREPPAPMFIMSRLLMQMKIKKKKRYYRIRPTFRDHLDQHIIPHLRSGNGIGRFAFQSCFTLPPSTVKTSERPPWVTIWQVAYSAAQIQKKSQPLQNHSSFSSFLDILLLKLAFWWENCSESYQS